MALEEYKGVYIYAQQVDNKLSDIAFELVGKAKELAADLNTEVTAVHLGSNVKALATELGEYGADKVIVVDNPALETYRTEPYAQALTAVINEFKPEIMLVGATAIGTGLNTPKGYTELVVKHLAEVTGLPCVPAEILIESTSDCGAYVMVHGSLNRTAVKLSKVCNDLRLLSSGPRAGIKEIN